MFELAIRSQSRSTLQSLSQHNDIDDRCDYDHDVVPTTQPSSTEGTLPATTSTATSPSTPENLNPLFGKVWEQIPTTSPRRRADLRCRGQRQRRAGHCVHSSQRGRARDVLLDGGIHKILPQLARAIVQGGYRVGDHTVDHPHLPSLSDATVAAEVADAAATITSATGASPSPLFRFPYGDSDARTLSVVNELGFVAVGWTMSTLWAGRGAPPGSQRRASSPRVMAGLRPGEIVLMHVGSNPNDGQRWTPMCSLR